MATAPSSEEDARMVKFGALMERGITVLKHFTGLRPGSAERVVYVDSEQTTLYTCKERTDPTVPGIDVKEFPMNAIVRVEPGSGAKKIEIATAAKTLVIEVDTERSRELLLSMLRRFVEVQSVKHGAAVVHEGYLDVRVGEGGFERRFFSLDGSLLKGYAMKISNQVLLGADLSQLRSVVIDPREKGTVLLMRFAPGSGIEPLALRHATAALLSEWSAHLLRALPPMPAAALPGHDANVGRGWLWKQALSGGGNWTRRFFVLPAPEPADRAGGGGGAAAANSGGHAQLRYYTDEESAARAGGAEPKGMLTVTATAKLARGFEGHPYSFTLDPGGGGKTLGAMAESEAECDDWMRVLQAAIDVLVHNTSIFNAANPLAGSKAANV